MEKIIFLAQWESEKHAHSNLIWMDMNLRKHMPEVNLEKNIATFSCIDSKQAGRTKRFLRMCGGQILKEENKV